MDDVTSPPRAEAPTFEASPFVPPNAVLPIAPQTTAGGPGRFWGPVAGLLSGAVGLAFGELCAAITNTAGPIVVVADNIVDRVPKGIKDWAIDTFGKNDKQALIVGTLIIVALYSLFVGWLAVRQFSRGAMAVVAFAVVGVTAALSGRSPSVGDLLGVLTALVATLVTLRVLTHARAWSNRATQDKLGASGFAIGRRRFLVMGGGAAVTAGAAFGAARAASGPDVSKVSAKPIPAGVAKLPKPAARLAAEVDIPEMPRWLTPTEDFYRIDTALVIPRINADTWSLKVTGMVDNELTISYEDIRNGRFGQLVEHDCTLMCVSNEIGGDLVGNARWTGVRLRDVLKAAGVQASADQIFVTSVDGFTAGFPVDVALDGREALLVIGMNGEPLIARHGFPARLVIPGIYGYVSAVKWLKEVNLTTFADDVGYWIPRGWAQLAPVKTCSRIDVVGTGGRIGPVKVGPTPIGGVAWAQHVGIAAVEVQIDDGPWEKATLAADGGVDTWRQWKFMWNATPGRHLIRVRATDTTGFTQRGEYVPVAPDGAEGWHTVGVEV